MNGFLNVERRLALIEGVGKMYIDLWKIYKPFAYEWEFLLLVHDDLICIKWIKKMSEEDYFYVLINKINEQYPEKFKEYHNLNEVECEFVDQWFEFCLWILYDNEKFDDLINYTVGLKISYEKCEDKYNFWLMLKEIFEIVYGEDNKWNNEYNDICNQIKELNN